MSTNTQVDTRKMDWHLFWTAAAVILTIGGMLLSSFISLSGKIADVDKRLSERLIRIETILEYKGILPPSNLAANKDLPK